MEEEELRVPTIPVEVTLILQHPNREDVTLYLAPGAKRHEGPESLIELLNRAGPFIPCKLSSGESAMASRDAIRCVIAAPDAGVYEEPGVPALDMVRVQIRDFQEIEGVVRHVDPEDRRLSDHFNNADRFFAIASGGSVYYVNKQHVVFIVP